MKLGLILCLVVLALVPAVAEAQWASQKVAIQEWGYLPGGLRSRMNVSPDGSLNLQGYSAYQRTAIDLRPNATKPPTVDAATELVLYRVDNSQGDWERMNWSAIATEPIHYRFGVERGGGGVHRPMVFAHEDVTPGVGLETVVIQSPLPATNRPFLPSNRVIIDPLTPDPSESGLGVVFNINGNPEPRWVEVGAPDSGGAGYRILRVKN